MKNVKSLLCTLVVCTFFLLNATQAQLPVDRNYSEKTIYLKGNKYIKDGIEYPNGFFFKNIKSEMEISPNAIVEYGKFEDNRNTSLLISGLALVGVLIAPNLKNKEVRNRVLLGSLGLSLVSIPISFKSANHFQKAIWIRNGDALFN